MQEFIIIVSIITFLVIISGFIFLINYYKKKNSKIIYFEKGARHYGKNFKGY